MSIGAASLAETKQATDVDGIAATILGAETSGTECLRCTAWRLAIRNIVAPAEVLAQRTGGVDVVETLRHV